MITRDHEKFEIAIKIYWQYFKEIENEIIETRRYVDFSSDNYGTFSVEYLKLYQAICSEIDVIGKTIANEIDENFKPEEKQNSIYKWWYIIQNGIKYPNWDDKKLCWNYVELKNAMVDFDNEKIIPWENFATEIRQDKKGANRTELVKGMKVPVWWSEYNKVKHHRTGRVKDASIPYKHRMNYSMANLGNVIKSFAGLYVLELSYLHAVGTKNDVEAFADHSVLFDKIMNLTSDDIDRICDFGDL